MKMNRQKALTKTLGGKKLPRRRTTSVSQMRSLSVHVIFLCIILLLWIVTLPRSFTKIWNYQARHLTARPEGFVGSLTSFAKYKNRTAKKNDDYPGALSLPQWMKDYFNWHKRQTEKLNEQNWKEHKYLILGCHNEDGNCGGLADRLKPLPFLLAVANKTGRIFMIRWSKPARLEEFLIPNHLNWSVPEWMDHHIQTFSRSVTTPTNISGTTIETNIHSGYNYRKTKGSKNVVKQMLHDNKVLVWESLVQDIFGGSALYEQIVTNTINSSKWKKKKEWNPMSGWASYKTMYHDLFRFIFLPSPPIQKLVEEKMKSANLTKGMYSTAHYRAFYAIEEMKHVKSSQKLKRFAIHAVECALSIRPESPVYFASDSKVAVDTIREYTRENQSRRIVTFSDEGDKEPLHLDKPTDWETKPSDYYATFVDLLMMANSRCLAYGQGGFGLYAALLSIDADCTVRHSTKRKLLSCTRKDAEINLEEGR